MKTYCNRIKLNCFQLQYTSKQNCLKYTSRIIDKYSIFLVNERQLFNLIIGKKKKKNKQKKEEKNAMHKKKKCN